MDNFFQGRVTDNVSFSAYDRLLQLIYKMMLFDEVGPRYQANSQRGTQITCVSPKVIDTAYKLLYSAPCS